MKSFTIHNLDDVLEDFIRKKAKQEGLSLNETIQKLLREALQLEKKNINITDKRKDFSHLLKVWNDEDRKEFHKAIQDFDTVYPVDWE